MFQLIEHALSVRLVFRQRCILSFFFFPRWLTHREIDFGFQQKKDDSTKWTLIYSNVSEEDIRGLLSHGIVTGNTRVLIAVSFVSPPQRVGRPRQVEP